MGRTSRKSREPQFTSHDQEVENAISESIFEHGSRPEVRHRTAPFMRLARFFFLVAAATAISAAGADLKSETVQQWEDYVKAADTRHADRLAQGAFLLSDEVAGQTTKLRNGGVVVTPASQHVPLKVQSGLIHDWTGAAFIPNAKLDDVLPVLRDYDRYKDYYRPNVVCSKRIATSESKDQFSMVLMNKSVIGRTALDAEYQTVYTQIDEHRWYKRHGCDSHPGNRGIRHAVAAYLAGEPRNGIDLAAPQHHSF